MKPVNLLITALMMLSIPAISLATDYSKFQHDSVEAYGFYKKALSLTSKPGTEKKSIATMKQFISSWEALANTYKGDPPDQFSSLNNFDTMIEQPLAIGQQALNELKGGKTKAAHSTLEEIRYLLWKMRTEAGVVTLSDKVNDFHEVMEIVLDKMHEEESVDNFRRIGQRYGAWMEIKWEEQSGMDVFSAERDTFTRGLADGRSAIEELRRQLKTGDIKSAKAAGKQVKKAYKTIFFLDSTS